MSQAIIAHDRDADKIPANIRDGVEIDWVVGNLVPGSLTSNIKPVHYIGTYETGYTQNVASLYGSFWTIQYGWCLWFMWVNYVGGISASEVRLIKLNLTTGVITEYNQALPHNWVSGTSFVLNGSTISANYHEYNDYHATFDMASSTSRTIDISGTATWTAVTNSETVWWKTYVCQMYYKLYIVQYNQTWWISWFIIS